MECICADGNTITSLIIFKGESLSTAWIPQHIPEDWRFSCNTRGWTSNVHGLEWLRRCFEPATRYKAEGQTRVLICDGHDSHISAEFIAHCINNNIILLILPPHTSHLLQPLDVGVFGPLKKAVSARLDRIIRTDVNRVQKSEFVECYMKAKISAFTSMNIQSGWRGAGLFPIDRVKIYRHLPRLSTPPPLPSTSSSNTPFNNELISSSPLNATSLHATNSALNELINTQQPLHTPARKYVSRLTNTTERLRAEISILKKEKENLESVLSARRKQKKGKRVKIDGQILLSTFELHQAVAQAERESKMAKRQKMRNGKKSQRFESSDSENSESSMEVDVDEMQDCIEVAEL